MRLAQGIGYALTEEICYNDQGQPLQDGFNKYILPTAEDLPEVKAIVVETNAAPPCTHRIF